MVLFHAAQQNIAPLGAALHTLHMTQVLAADAEEILIRYIGMAIVTCYLRLSDPFAYCSFPYVCIIA